MSRIFSSGSAGMSAFLKRAGAALLVAGLRLDWGAGAGLLSDE